MAVPMVDDWSPIQPRVNETAEFLEIVHDFANPFEIVREAISNSIDAHCSRIDITVAAKEIEGVKKLVIEIRDDGDGMTREVLETAFWGLGHSPSRFRSDAIGEKGHGTKIYLRSERVFVRTKGSEGAYESYCDYPLRALSQGQLHQPKIKKITDDKIDRGTYVRVEGYNGNERSQFTHARVKDYILWFTKFGSIETAFNIDALRHLKLHLHCLDSESVEEISFGHVFPDQTKDIRALFDKYGADAAERFVKHYSKRARLERHPDVQFESFISVEGDRAKRDYNPMIRDRGRKSVGTYKVADRYGLWLCKDFIPIMTINDWISGFGGGSNAYVLLHGFINCQSLKLTANRGSIANTDPQILQEMKSVVAALLDEIDLDLNRNEFYTLMQIGHEARTLNQEREEFKRRVKNIEHRNRADLDGQTVFEPKNESELFGLFMVLYAKRPAMFDFIPLDYNTNRGIDIIAKSRSTGAAGDSPYRYLELKYLLTSEINHSFTNLRWILCWDFDQSITDETRFSSIDEGDERVLRSERSTDGAIYFLDNPRSHQKIEVLRLKEFLTDKIKLEFKK